MNNHSFIFTMIPAILLSFGCSRGGTDIGEENPEPFNPTGWNGYFVEAMAGAFSYFTENDKMPATINVEGINYNKGKYVAAGCRILKKIIDDPVTWQDEEVDYIQASCPDNDANNTVDKDELAIDEFVRVVETIYEYAETKGIFPNYCTLDEDHKDADGSEYSTKLTINSIAIMFARIFDCYAQNGSLPETVSTWSSDFLRETANCSIDDPVVISTMETAISGKTSDYDRAKAIFEYARDEWTWENYYNTSRGAVRTIEDKAGNCCDLSHAIVAMGRAAGIPSRYRHAQCQYASGIIGHVMAELYVDGVWYLCDASNDENTFGNHEAWLYMATFNGRYNELPF